MTSEISISSSEKPDEISDRPGSLENSEVPQITLHTHLGQMLFTGRKAAPKKPEIVGLLRFASQIRIIWNGACQDDPYADWWLVKVDEAFQSASHTLRVTLEQVQSLFSETQSVTLSLGISSQPLQMPLQFTSPYAYRGAYLVADLDFLARTIISARHFGLISTNDNQRLLMLTGRSVRRAFLTVMSYKSLGLARTDIQQGNAKSVHALEVMGEIPEDILNGKTRPDYAPTVVRNSETMSSRDSTVFI